MATRKNTLAAADYRALLRDVKKLTQAGESKATFGKIEAQWNIGKRIVALKLRSEAGYHNSVIRDLAADSGLAMTTLHQSVQFYEAYKLLPKDDGLTWAHYRCLLRVPKDKDRGFYVAKVQQERWTTRQLEAAIANGLHEGRPSKKLLLTRPTRSDYVYSARVLDVVDSDTLDLSIDVGFGVKRELRARLAEIDAPTLETIKGRAARDFVALHLIRAASVAVQTLKSDKYGRYVVHVFFATRKLSAIDCFEKGQHMNELLVRNKHAVVMK